MLERKPANQKVIHQDSEYTFAVSTECWLTFTGFHHHQRSWTDVQLITTRCQRKYLVKLKDELGHLRNAEKKAKTTKFSTRLLLRPSIGMLC